MGFKPEVRPLSFFQDDYGLQAPGSSDDEDEDEGSDEEGSEDEGIEE